MPDDLIPRSKAIEAIKAAKEKGNIFYTLNPEKTKEKTPHAFVILRKALDAIDAIPAVEVPIFESVDDPPTEDGTYFVYFEDGSACNVIYEVKRRQFGVYACYWNEVQGFSNVWEEVCPTHWMKPPKEVHHETD